MILIRLRPNLFYAMVSYHGVLFVVVFTKLFRLYLFFKTCIYPILLVAVYVDEYDEDEQ